MSTVDPMVAHHEAAQTAVTGWLALGGLGGLMVGARVWWAKVRRR